MASSRSSRCTVSGSCSPSPSPSRAASKESRVISTLTATWMPLQVPLYTWGAWGEGHGERVGCRQLV